MIISKQKQNLINELSFIINKYIDHVNDNTKLTNLYKKTNIKTLIHIVKSSYYYTNKEIKELITEFK
jgi:hypothetical protein